MKKNLLILSILFVFASCKSLSYFTSPNDLRNIPATLHLLDGRNINGKLIVQQNTFSNTVKIYIDGKKDPEKYNLYEVKGYTIRNEYYALKSIRDISSGRDLVFMRRMTAPNSKINLYENSEQKSNNSSTNNSTTTRTDYSYYVELPGESASNVWSISSSRFTPEFDQKVSQQFKDCPSLSEKIAKKQSGYFYALFSLFEEKKLDVWMNIIKEYNSCK